MRNLKKILALVLALVMSLSLMATAGASSFSDVEAGNQYETAIDVLDALKVFIGYTDGTFQPDGELTRAEAAVLVYRIATGDVEGKYVDNYTYMVNNKFTDLTGYGWAVPYINYCQNAEIVVGTSATTFSPGMKVTGYQLMVMVLRTLGYGKAGEFTGATTWELETASKCEQLGMLKNVTEGDFGQPAKRAMVAEILFRGLLQETVTYSTFTSGGYTSTGETLGYREFGLEDVKGVVMANEWANLDSTSVLAAGTTRLVTDEGKTLTVSNTTDLDAVGQTHTAYVANADGGKKALTLELSGNTVAFNEGKATTVSDLAKKEGLSLSGADYFVNYSESREDKATSDDLIRYVVTDYSIEKSQTSDIYKQWSTYLEGLDSKKVSKKTYDVTYEAKDGTKTTVEVTEYTVTLRPETIISATDLEIMQEIFYSANRLYREKDENDNIIREGYVDGEVYVGTSSLNDVSDDISWKKFKETYLTDDIIKEYTDAKMGESLRIIDNDGDSKAEYVFKIEYVQDKVVASVKDELVLNSIKMADFTGNNRYDPDEVTVGDIVNYTKIDGKLSIWTADIVTGTIDKKSFKDTTVTVKDGDTYDQSEIDNQTSLDEYIMNMADYVKYNMYLDEFGNIRTYELAESPAYAVLTEMYPTTNQNWNYVQKNTYWVEMTYGEEKTDEYITDGDNLFLSDDVWSQRLLKKSNVQLSGDYNYLQPAVAHLGFNTYGNAEYLGEATGLELVVNDEAWNRSVFLAEKYTTAKTDGLAIPTTDKDGNAVDFYGVFAYNNGAYYKDPNTQQNVFFDEVSFTNVARYVLSEDGESVTLKTASERYVDQQGNYWFYGEDVDGNWTKKTAEEWAKYNKDNKDKYPVGDPRIDYTDVKDIKEANSYFYVYAVDYVQLKNADIRSGDRHFYIDDNYSLFYNTNSNGYVDALDTTEFFIVYPDTVKHVVGYKNLPSIDKGTIRASYAVAQNTISDNRDQDYWTADVIVIEVEKNTDTHAGNVGLMYYNPSEQSGNVRDVETLYTGWHGLGADDADLTVVPEGGTKADYAWGNHSWTDEDYGFYDLYPKTNDDGDAEYNKDTDELSVSKSVKIPHGDDKLFEDGNLRYGYNRHNIWAGVITRMERVTNSHYLDASAFGLYGGKDISINTEWTDKDDDNNDVTVGVPFYKLVDNGRYTDAEEMLVLSDPKASDVQKGDFIIVVGGYSNGWISQAAYVVDLGNWADLVAKMAKKLVDDQLKSIADPEKTPDWLFDIWVDIAQEQGAIDPVLEALIALAKSATVAEDGVDYINALIAALEQYTEDNDEDLTSTEETAIAEAIAALKAKLDADEATTVADEVKKKLAALAADNDIDTDGEVYTQVLENIDALVAQNDVDGLKALLDADSDSGLDLDATAFAPLKALLDEMNAPETELPTADENNVITLKKDVELAAEHKFEDAGDVTLDLNGHTLTVQLEGKTNDNAGGDPGIRVEGATNLTITNGDIVVEGKHNHGITIDNVADSETASLVIEEGVTISVDDTGFSNGADYFSNCVMISNGAAGKVNVEINGTLKGCCGFYVNGNIKNSAADYQVSFGPSAVIDATYIGMYLAGSATTTVDGATISGDFTGIEISNGTLIVNDGEISGQNTGGFGTYPAFAGASGQITTGAGIAVTPYGTANGPIVVELNGGTVSGAQDLAFAQRGTTMNSSVEVTFKASCISKRPYFAGTCKDLYDVPTEADSWGYITITGMEQQS